MASGCGGTEGKPKFRSVDEIKRLLEDAANQKTEVDAGKCRSCSGAGYVNAVVGYSTNGIQGLPITRRVACYDCHGTGTREGE